jgi:hypothetical protein
MGEKLLSGFNFLILCQSVYGEPTTTIEGVLQTISPPDAGFPFDIEMTAVIGVTLSPNCEGKMLDLIAFKGRRKWPRATQSG